MHLIPQDPEFTDGQSAERAVWELLKESLPDECVVAHSVQIKHGSAEHEIDILVLWPGVGMAAIEVKGGLISCEGGQWFQSDRSRGKQKLRSPVAQCQGAVHAFKNWLTDRLGTPISSRFAYMVALPYSMIPEGWDLTGAPRTILLDQSDLQSAAEKIRHAIETEGGATQPLAPSFLNRIVPKLEGNFAQPSVASAGHAELEHEQDYLTARQATLLSATRSLPRIKFTGGAGSGKTWLAVEKAKRLAKSGKRVGLFCYNKGLGMYLQDQVSSWKSAKPTFTGEFHEYVRSCGVPDGEGQDYFDETMPGLLKTAAASMPESEKFDAVIVDEAQDFAPLWWDALRACLKEPDDGEIYAFLDDRQDVYRRWGNESSVADLVPIHIDENLRNTRNIANAFKPLAADGFTPKGSTGLPVRRVQCATEDAVDMASDCIDALIDEGWANNQIALLTTKSRHPIHRDRSDSGTIEDYWREFHEDKDEFYGHVLGFKGLERSVVILCINGFHDFERAQELLYVGLSRARCLLVIVGDSALLHEVGGNPLELALKGAQDWRP